MTLNPRTIKSIDQVQAASDEVIEGLIGIVTDPANVALTDTEKTYMLVIALTASPEINNASFTGLLARAVMRLAAAQKAAERPAPTQGIHTAEPGLAGAIENLQILLDGDHRNNAERMDTLIRAACRVSVEYDNRRHRG